MSISLGELATRFGCELDGDPDTIVDGLASLSNAGPRSLSYLANSTLTEQLSATKAAAVILRAPDAPCSPTASLISADPYVCYARMAAVVAPQPAIVPGVHPSAIIAETATVSASAQLAAHVVVGERSVIGEHVYAGPGCIIGPDCKIAPHCRLVANVVLARNVTIGARGMLHPGAVIGGDGFGNAMTPEGWIKVPQVGGVRIGDDVEIGANSTIDCGALDDTVIEDGVRIDNLCMVAHNVHIGAHTALAAMTGIAGSAVIGKRCMFAGQSGCVGHIEICDDVIIGGQGMLSKDITEPGLYASSFPVEKSGDWNRKVARFRRIEALAERVKKLEKGNK